jgi:hypothetical protein
MFRIYRWRYFFSAEAIGIFFVVPNHRNAWDITIRARLTDLDVCVCTLVYQNQSVTGFKRFSNPMFLAMQCILLQKWLNFRFSNGELILKGLVSEDMLFERQSFVIISSGPACKLEYNAIRLKRGGVCLLPGRQCAICRENMRRTFGTVQTPRVVVC